MKYDYKLIKKDRFVYDELLELLCIVDKDFPIPLSHKIDFDLFLEKIKDNGLVYCAYDKENLIGACFFYCNDEQTKTAYLSVLCVLKQYRGQGIGEKLVNLMIDYCVNQKFKIIQLYTRCTNVAARNLYKQLGFIEIKSDRENDIKLEKAL